MFYHFDNVAVWVPKNLENENAPSSFWSIKIFSQWVGLAVFNMLHNDWLIHRCEASNVQSDPSRCEARTLRPDVLFWRPPMLPPFWHRPCFWIWTKFIKKEMWQCCSKLWVILFAFGPGTTLSEAGSSRAITPGCKLSFCCCADCAFFHC